MVLRLALATFATLAGSIVAAAHANQSLDGEPIGIVDRISGEWWRAQDRRVLTVGELIYTGQTVLVSRPTSHASISIVMFATGQRWEQACREASPCQGSYRPAATDARQTGFWAFLSAFWTSDRRLDVVVPGSRSAEDHGPNHALLLRSGTSVGLGPALERVRAGSYRVTLTAAPDSPSAGSVSSFEDRIRIGPDAGAEVQGLAPGLYLLALANGAGERVGSDAAVLVVDRDDVRSEQVWKDARARMNAWSTLSPRTVDALLVCVLYALDAGRGRP